MEKFKQSQKNLLFYLVLLELPPNEIIRLFQKGIYPKTLHPENKKFWITYFKNWIVMGSLKMNPPREYSLKDISNYPHRLFLICKDINKHVDRVFKYGSGKYINFTLKDGLLANRNTLPNLFLSAGQYGRLEGLEKLKYIWNKCKEREDMILKAIITAIRYGHLQFIKWIWNNMNIFMNGDDINISFIQAAENGHQEILEFLWHHFEEHINCLEDAFEWAAAKGHLKIMTWIWKISNVNIHADDEEAFRMAARNGHLHVLKWLWEISNGSINVHGVDIYSLLLSLNYPEIKKWVNSLHIK